MDIFYLVHRKRVIQRKPNFQIAYKSYKFEARTKFVLLCLESFTLQILWHTFCDFGFTFPLHFF